MAKTFREIGMEPVQTGMFLGGAFRVVLNQGVCPTVFTEGVALAAYNLFGKDAGGIRAGF